MRTFTASLIVVGLALTQGRPQGILNGISNLLTNAFGSGGNSGEVDDYQNAPYEVIQAYDWLLRRGFTPVDSGVCTKSAK
eukprot:UN00110